MSRSEVFTTSQAADFLEVHVQTIRRFARAGRIPGFKIGADWRFRREALVQWADNQRFEERGNNGACTVLIVDHEEKAGAALARMTEQFGCCTRQALSAKVGLELIDEEAPDLILLDLMIPGMNCPSFLKELRKKYPTLPVAIVTGHPDSELLKDVMLHGPILLVPKPVDSELLERTMRTVVGKKLQFNIKAVARGAEGRNP